MLFDGVSEVDAYRFFWRTLWQARINDTQSRAAGRQSYGEHETSAVIRDAIAALDLRSTDSLLDIGCAKGLLGDRLRGHVRRYVGMDYIQGMRPAVVGDAVRLPFGDATFDKTLMAGVLVCIAPELNPLALSEMRRVTKVGGRGFVAANLAFNGHRWCSMYQPNELTALAERCGWTRAWIRPMSTTLQQPAMYFDMVVEA